MAVKRIEVPVKWETQGDEDLPPNVYWVSDKHDGPHSGNFTSKEQALAYEKYKGKPDQIPGLREAAYNASKFQYFGNQTPYHDHETGNTSYWGGEWIEDNDPAKYQEYIDRAMNSPLDWVGQNINWSGIGHGGDFSALDNQIQFLKDNKYDLDYYTKTGVVDKNAFNQYNLTKQILAQGTTGKWSGQGFGSPIENAKQMARVLSTAGIEDIKDFGRVTRPKYGPVDVVREMGSERDYEGFQLPTGNYYYVDSSGEKKYVDPKSVVIGSAPDPENNYYTTYQVHNVPTGGEETVWGNKKTQQGMTEDYGGSGNYFSGTFAGHGRTNYGVQFAADGTPYFYSQFGGDTSSMGDILPVVALGLSIFAPGIGTAIGTALGATGVTATVLGSAIVQGTMAELSGGDFVNGAIKGAITAGVAPAVSSTIGTAVADAMGDSVFNKLVTDAVTSASTAAVTTGLTGDGDILDAALKSAVLSVGSNVGQELGTSYQYGTSPFTEQNQILTAQERGLGTTGDLGGKLGVSAGKIASGADAQQVLTSTLISEATKGVTDTLKSTVKDALKDSSVKVADTTDDLGTQEVNVPGAEDLQNIINGSPGTQLASSDNDAALQAIEDLRNTAGADDALLGLSSAEVGQGEEDAIAQANLDALGDLSSAEVGQGEQDAIDQASLDAILNSSSAAVGQGEDAAIDQANLDALGDLSSAAVGEGEDAAIDQANLDDLLKLSSAEAGDTEVDAINYDKLLDLSSAEAGDTEVDAVNYDKLLDLSSAEVGKDEQKAIDDALKTDVTTTITPPPPSPPPPPPPPPPPTNTDTDTDTSGGNLLALLALLGGDQQPVKQKQAVADDPYVEFDWSKPFQVNPFATPTTAPKMYEGGSIDELLELLQRRG
jgi:hypothetical protein